jgi:hypothetical protein
VAEAEEIMWVVASVSLVYYPDRKLIFPQIMRINLIIVRGFRENNGDPVFSTASK